MNARKIIDSSLAWEGLSNAHWFQVTALSSRFSCLRVYHTFDVSRAALQTLIAPCSHFRRSHLVVPLLLPPRLPSSQCILVGEPLLLTLIDPVAHALQCL